jgi:hypothetical protein
MPYPSELAAYGWLPEGWARYWWTHAIRETLHQSLWRGLAMA